jgi:poly(beta-D-mannuronate) lyase
VRDLDIPRFYADAAGSKVDPEALAAHDKAVEPMTQFVRALTSQADKALRREDFDRQRTEAACALAALEAWARANALLGRMAQAQAEYQRKWDLAGIALAYVKLKPYASIGQRKRIEPWLETVADAARAFYDDPRRIRNNHWYWLGLGLGAVGIAADSERHWVMARGIMADAARDIDTDGRLAKELERGSRAFFYHVFSVMPLVVLAELGSARNEDFYALGDGALHRLISVVHTGLADPVAFERITGLKQDGTSNTRAGWLQLYLARFPDRLKPPHPGVPPGHRWLGGDDTLLKRALGQP